MLVSPSSQAAQSFSNPNDFGALLLHYKRRPQRWMFMLTTLAIPIVLSILRSQTPPAWAMAGATAAVCFLPIGLYLQERRLTGESFHFHERGLRSSGGKIDLAVNYDQLIGMQFAATFQPSLILHKAVILGTTDDGQKFRIYSRRIGRNPDPTGDFGAARVIITRAVANSIEKKLAANHPVWLGDISVSADGLTIYNGSVVDWRRLEFFKYGGSCDLRVDGAAIKTFRAGTLNLLPISQVAQRRGSSITHEDGELVAVNDD